VEGGGATIKHQRDIHALHGPGHVSNIKGKLEYASTLCLVHVPHM